MDASLKPKQSRQADRFNAFERREAEPCLDAWHDRPASMVRIASKPARGGFNGDIGL
jgi:hypothetical protein